MTEREAELERRMSLWHALQDAGGPDGVPASVVKSLRIYYGGRGIWRDKAGLSHLKPEGVTVGLYHTGRHYADDVSDGAILYHYPSTKNTTTDAGEVAATKAAKELALPVFVSIQDARQRGLRHVHMGWVETWDDELRQFLITFGQDPSISEVGVSDDDFDPTKPQVSAGRKQAQGERRPNQHRFRFQVLQRYGSTCAMCGLSVTDLIEAAHLVAWAETHNDDPRNGLPLCRNHHRALELGLVRIDPTTGEFVTSENGPNLEVLGITAPSLSHLQAKPHPKSIRWLWQHTQE